MGNYLSNSNLTAGRKRNLSQAELDDADECDAQRGAKRRRTSDNIYEALFVNGENSDVTICALGQEWALHKTFLCQSGFFSSMFSGAWKESSLNRIEMLIPDEFVTQEALTIVFGFLYRDEILIDPSTVASVLATASLLNLDHLIQQCADVMLENINMDTVCDYYTTGRLYGAKDVPEKCIKYLQATLMPTMTVQLLRAIEPEFMMKLIESVDLLVLHVEMDIYSMLRKWLFLRLNPNYKGSIRDLVPDTDTFIQSEKANSWKTSFLETPHGDPYVEVFKRLRIDHILTDLLSAQILESDGILPYVWLLNCYRSKWLLLLRVTSGQDVGPKDLVAETFDKESVRCGRKLDTEGLCCWRWTGFDYGIDLVVSCFNRRIFLKRKIPSSNCQSSVVHLQPRKHLTYRLTVSAASDLHQSPLTQTTGIKHHRLRKDKQVCVLRVERNISFPIYLSCNFLLYTPHPDAPNGPLVADIAAAGIKSHQPLPGPSA